MHVRPSNTEPIVRVIAEAPGQADAEGLCREVGAMLMQRGDPGIVWRRLAEPRSRGARLCEPSLNATPRFRNRDIVFPVEPGNYSFHGPVCRPSLEAVAPLS